MPNSYKKRRKIEAPLKELRRNIRADVNRVIEWLQITPTEERRQYIEDHVFEMSDPWRDGYFEAPIPSHRWDLRQHYISFLLIWEEGDPPVEELMAPWLMPMFTHDADAKMYSIGQAEGPSYDDTTEAFRSVHRRADDLVAA